MDYLVGRRSGFYPPSAPPTYVKKDASETVFDILRQELPKVVLKEAVSHLIDRRVWQTAWRAVTIPTVCLSKSVSSFLYAREHHWL